MRALELFRTLDDHALAPLLERASVRDGARGDVVFRQGDPGRCLGVVLSGTVKLVHVGAGGRRVIELVGPGDHFGESALLDAGPRHATAVVVSDCEYASLPADALDALLHTEATFAAGVGRMLARRIIDTQSSASHVALHDASTRLARQLLRLAAKHGVPTPTGIFVPHGLTQTELAELVGISRETVNKLLTEFAGRGWLQSEKYGFHLLRRGELARRAGIPRSMQPDARSA